MRDYFLSIKTFLVKEGIARFYPSFLEEIDWYENHYNSASYSFIMNCQERSQYFAAEIKLTNNSSYFLIWNIDQILQDLPKYSLKVIRIPVESEAVYYDSRNTNPERVMYYKKNPCDTPILLVWIEYIQKYYVIDGNHRITACRDSNINEVEGIILPASIHLKYMVSDISRMHYKIFHNISIMCSIWCHPRCVVSEKVDERNSLYPITNIRLRLGVSRCIGLRLFRLLTKSSIQSSVIQ